MTVCVSGYSQHPTPAAAVGEVVGDVLGRLDPHPDLAVLFASGRFTDQLGSVVAAVQTLLAPRVLVGSDVPRVFGGSDDRPSADGLLLLAAHTDKDADLIAPIRYDPAEASLGWHTIDGAPLSEDGVTLALTEPAVGVAGVPGAVVGVGGSAEQRLILDHTIYPSGGVGVQLPTSVAKPFDFTLPLWEDVVRDEWDAAANEYVEEHVLERHGEVFDPGDGAGLLLFAARSALAPMGARFDFEIAFDRFSGSVAGALAPVVWSPEPTAALGPKDRSICGLVLR